MSSGRKVAVLVGLATLATVGVSFLPGMRAVFIGYIAASVCICLPVIYWITAPDWWKSRTGRALMMLLGSLAALFLLLLTSTFLPGSAREVLRYVIFTSVLVGGFRLAVLFFQLRLGPGWARKDRK
jgi:hypothetical protein